MTKFVRGSISQLVNKNGAKKSNKVSKVVEVVDEESSDEEYQDAAAEPDSDDESADGQQEDDSDNEAVVAEDDDEDDAEVDAEEEEDEAELLDDLVSEEEQDNEAEADQDDEEEEEENDDDGNEEDAAAGEETPKNTKRKTDDKTESKKSSKKQKQEKENADDSGDGEEEPQEEKKRHQPDNPEKLARTLFVGNLGHDFDKKEFKRKLIEYGPLQNFRVRSIAPGKESLTKKVSFLSGKVNPNKATVNVYAVYKTPEAVEKALSMNNTEVCGHIVRVDRCIEKKTYQNTDKTIFVGNMPMKASDNELREFFSQVGPVNMVRIVRDTRSQAGKGFAYVEFKTKEAYQAAMERNGQAFMNRELRISKYQYSKPKNQQRSFQGTQSKKGAGRKPGAKPGAKSFSGEISVKRKRMPISKEKRAKAKISQKKKIAKILTSTKAP